MTQLPKIIPIFPLSNFIIFPESAVPLNIFEPRYIQMIDDAMKTHRIIGMIQPKKNNEFNKPDLYKIGCAGKIISFSETDDGRYLIVLSGISRFKIINEIRNEKLYRECNVNFSEFDKDLNKFKEDIKFTDLEIVFKNFKTLLKKEGYIINLKDLQKKNSEETINTLSMASPFTLEEKQVLLETKDLKKRKEALEEILKTYILDNFSNSTIQ